MAKVELKQPIIKEIAEAVDGAQSAVLVQYLGITVEQDTALRKELREAGVHYKVYKNTLMKRAFEGTDFAQLDGVLEGPSAIAVSKDDATAPARILAKFGKTAQNLEIKAGKIEYRLDKTNIIHVPIGKASFTEEQLADNFQTLMDAINKAKPASLKGQYIKSISLAPTMGPGVKLNVAKVSN